MMERKRMNRIAAALAVASAATLTPLASADLVGQWLFDQQDLDENSGYQADGVHDGQAIGTVTFSTDTPFSSGYSIDLTGGDNAVQVLNSNQQVNGSLGGGANGTYEDTFDTHLYNGDAMTISFWAKGSPDNDWEPFVSKKGEASHGYQVRRRSSTQDPTFTLRSSTGDDDPSSTAVGMNDGQWHQYTATYDGTSRKLYVDGVEVINIADSGLGNSPINEYLLFGARDNSTNPGISNFSRVQMDDVRIYDHAVSVSHIDAVVAGHQVVFGADDRLADLGLLGGATTEGLRIRENNAFTVVTNPTNIDEGELALFQKEFKADAVTVVSQVNFASDGGGPGNIGGDVPFAHDPGGDDNVLEISGVIRIDAPGQYVFGVNSDDGFRLRMGNNLATVSEFVGTGANSDTHVELSFTEAGYYAYRLTHFEATGGQHLEFYAKNGSNDAYEDGVDQLIGSANGLQAIANGQFQLRLVQSAGTLIDSLADAEGLLDGSIASSGTFRGYADVIDFHDGAGDPNDHGNGDAAFLNNATTDFALEATGKLLVTETSTYTFLTSIDDGAALWIDGILVFSADRTGPVADFLGEIDLTAGVHDLRYLFFERTGGGSSELLVAKGSHGSYNATHFEFVNDITEGSLAVFAIAPAPAALPAGLAMLGIVATRRRRRT